MSKKPLTKLILTDDDEDILRIVKYALEPLKGVEIRLLNSGEETIAQAIEFEPDLIILDVMMPKLDGIQTLKSIRSLPSIAHIPVVFFTASVHKESLKTYSEMGVIDLIIKPFDAQTLPSTIQNIWEKCP